MAKQMECSFILFAILIFTVTATDEQIINYRECGRGELFEAWDSFYIFNSVLQEVFSKERIFEMCPHLEYTLSDILLYSKVCKNLLLRRFFKDYYDGYYPIVENVCKNETFLDEYVSLTTCEHDILDNIKYCHSITGRTYEEIRGEIPEDKMILVLKRGGDISKIQYPKKYRIQEEPENRTNENDNPNELNEGEIPVEITQKLCCLYEELITCSAGVTKSACGDKAADLRELLLRYVIEPKFKRYCENINFADC